MPDISVAGWYWLSEFTLLAAGHVAQPPDPNEHREDFAS